MSTQIEYTVKNLYDKKLIVKYSIRGHEYALIWINDDISINIFVVDDRYEITIADVEDAIKHLPEVNYLVYSSWQNFTGAAKRRADEAQLKMISFGKLCYTIEELKKSDEDSN